MNETIARRAFLLVFCCLSLVFSPSLISAVESIPESRFDFTYKVRIGSIPQNVRDLKIWVPIARTDEYQKIVGLQIQSPYPYKLFEDGDYGNKILHLSFDQPPSETLDLEVRYDVSVKGEKMSYEELKSFQLSGESLEREQEKLGAYLSSQSLLVINEKIREIAGKVTRAKKTDLEKAKAIYDYVVRRMVYDKSGEGWGQGSTVYACEVGKGNCTDFHSLFISLARASGIPSRFKIGAQIPNQQPEGTIGYHCWAEFYLEGRGWIPVDASEAWKHPELEDFYFGSHDPWKFFITLGRDISLAPAQKGNPINIFIYPYVEVDGKPFDAVESKFFYRNKLNAEV